MNNIQYLLSEIFNNVDNQLLKLAFSPHKYYGAGEHFSLEYQVKQEVIYEAFLADLNMIGGQACNVYINDLPYQEIEGGYFYQIPLSRTKGRHITLAHAIVNGMPDITPIGGSGMQGAGNRLMNVNQAMEDVGTAELLPGAPNCIFVTERVYSGQAFLRCTIENDDELQNFGRQYLPDLAEAVVLKCKFMIYNRLNSIMGDGDNGTINSYIRSALDDCQAAGEMYRELMNSTLPKISIMQDKSLMGDLLSMQIML